MIKEIYNRQNQFCKGWFCLFQFAFYEIIYRPLLSI